MADLAYRNEVPTVRGGRVAWGAIWAGMFTFVAIWSVFGLLGEAIFASSANANASQSATGVSVGMGIWSIILTIIAMYVAGRVTAHFSDVIDRGSRIMYGMAMFGLSVTAVIVAVLVGTNALSGGAGITTGPHSPYLLNMSPGAGWLGFVCLLLGWLAAMGGAAHQGVTKGGLTKGSNVQDIRPAA
jgi:hypothetical protein